MVIQQFRDMGSILRIVVYQLHFIVLGLHDIDEQAVLQHVQPFLTFFGIIIQGTKLIDQKAAQRDAEQPDHAAEADSLAYPGRCIPPYHFSCLGVILHIGIDRKSAYDQGRQDNEYSGDHKEGLHERA